MERVIGTNTIGYPEVRNFAGLPFSKYKVIKKQNLYKIPAYFYFKIKKNTHLYYWNTFNDLDFHDVELFHFFNALSVGKTPWITTFETVLPRWGNDRLIRRGLELIAGSSCKKIIALSECAANLQISLVENVYPEMKDVVKEKLIVMHPSQKKLIGEYSDKKLDDECVVFTMVGNQIFSKGGREVIKVMSNLIKKGSRIKLNLVSNLSFDQYVTMTSEEDVVEMIKMIKNNDSYIDHYSNVDNSVVIKLLLQSHVALLPTYADTYGYFVLEAQAAGCPVITTDIRALPEINNDEIGWMIEVPKDEHGNGILSSKLERESFGEIMYAQLYSIIESIVNCPGVVKEKGSRALLKIDAMNSVDENTLMLETLYDKIVLSKN